MRMPGLWKSLTGAFKQKMKNLDASLEHVKEEAQTAHMMALAEMRTGEARKKSLPVDKGVLLLTAIR